MSLVHPANTQPEIGDYCLIYQKRGRAPQGWAEAGRLGEKVMETQHSYLSGMVTGSALRELPLNGRDLFQLTLLQPGVLPTTTAGPNPWAEGSITKASVLGARPTMNNINLDGADINDPGFNTPVGGVAGVQAGVEAIQEFRVLLNGYSARIRPQRRRQYPARKPLRIERVSRQRVRVSS